LLGVQHNVNDLLDELKDKSIFLGKLWKEAGKPKLGHLFSIKYSCSLKYENTIKQAMYEYININLVMLCMITLSAKSTQNFGNVGVINLAKIKWVICPNV